MAELCFFSLRRAAAEIGLSKSTRRYPYDLLQGYTSLIRVQTLRSSSLDNVLTPILLMQIIRVWTIIGLISRSLAMKAWINNKLDEIAAGQSSRPTSRQNSGRQPSRQSSSRQPSRQNSVKIPEADLTRVHGDYQIEYDANGWPLRITGTMIAMNAEMICNLLYSRVHRSDRDVTEMEMGVIQYRANPPSWFHFNCREFWSGQMVQHELDRRLRWRAQCPPGYYPEEQTLRSAKDNPDPYAELPYIVYETHEGECVRPTNIIQEALAMSESEREAIPGIESDYWTWSGRMRHTPQQARTVQECDSAQHLRVIEHNVDVPAGTSLLVASLRSGFDKC